MTQDVTTIAPKPTGVKRQKIRKWVLRLTLAFAVLGPLTFAVAAIGYKMGLFGLGTSFSLLNMKVGPLFLALSMIFAIISMILAWTIKPNRGFVIAAIAAIIPAIAGAKLAQTRATVAELPFIHDVSTDTQNPPMFTEAILKLRGASSNPADYIGKKDPRGTELVSVLQSKAYPDVRSVILSDEPKVVFGKAEAVVKQMGWELVSEDANSGLIEATDTTFWYGFKDDVIIRIKPSEGGGSVVDVRSLSRVGGSDIGKNADRIRDFIGKLQAS